MARSRSVVAPAAVLGAVIYLVAPQLVTFVAPSAPASSSRLQLRGRVALAATAADVKAAKDKLDLQLWAAQTLAQQGSADAAAAQARAQQAEQAYLALKAEAEGSAPPPAVAPAAPAAPAAPVAAAAPAAGVPVKEEVEDAKNKAELMSWAAKTLQAQGSPEAAAMQARAERKTQEYLSLKAAFESGAPAAAVGSAPVPAPASAPAAAVSSGSVPTKEEVAYAKEKADLMVWAAKALVAKGAPQAAEMQVKADAKMQIYQSLKAAFESGAPAAAAAAAPTAAPPAPAPVAAAPTPVSSDKVPTAAELAEFKKGAELMSWAADALAAKGAPQAAEMRAKADQKLKTYETLKALAAA